MCGESESTGRRGESLLRRREVQGCEAFPPLLLAAERGKKGTEADDVRYLPAIRRLRQGLCHLVRPSQGFLDGGAPRNHQGVGALEAKSLPDLVVLGKCRWPLGVEVAQFSIEPKPRQAQGAQSDHGHHDAPGDQRGRLHGLDLEHPGGNRREIPQSPVGADGHDQQQRRPECNGDSRSGEEGQLTEPRKTREEHQGEGDEGGEEAEPQRPSALCEAHRHPLGWRARLRRRGIEEDKSGSRSRFRSAPSRRPRSAPGFDRGPRQRRPALPPHRRPREERHQEKTEAAEPHQKNRQQRQDRGEKGHHDVALDRRRTLCGEAGPADDQEPSGAPGSRWKRPRLVLDPSEERR